MEGWVAISPQKFGSGAGYRLRLLPSEPFYQARRMHRINDKPFPCGRSLNTKTAKWEGKCLACDHYNDFWKSGAPRCWKGTPEEFQHHLMSLKPIERYYYKVIDRDNENKGPMRWACGKTLHTTIIEAMVGNPMMPNIQPLGDVTHPLLGYDFFINATMKRLPNGNEYPDYKGSQFLPTSKLHEDPAVVKQWLEAAASMQFVHVVRSDEAVLEALKAEYGYLGAPRGKKRYRNITEPWQPAW